MSFTAEQEKVVLKILSYKSHQYYEILEVQKTATDSEIKKSYRKLAIKLHPDKNQHPRSSEAFKSLNKAWEVLSDSSKRRIYDQTGSDPDARFIPSAGAAGDGMRRRGGGGGGGGIFSEEDIFNHFFGMGQGQTFSFNGNGFTFQSFGGPQFRTHQTRHTSQQRQRQAKEDEDVVSQFLRQLVPVLMVLMMFFGPMLLQLLTGDLGPEYSFEPTTQHTVLRTTPSFNIPFYVKEGFNKDNKLSKRQVRTFDSKVEHNYVNEKRHGCTEEQLLKNEKIEDAHGWFSVDQKKLEEARAMPMPNCKFLRDHGLI